MSARYTSELANDFGNLASRSAAMVEKYCAGSLPAVSHDADLEKALKETVANADAAMCALDFQGGINAIMDFCKQVNGYVTIKEPWILAKDPANQASLEEVLYNTAESLRAQYLQSVQEYFLLLDEETGLRMVNLFQRATAQLAQA